MLTQIFHNVDALILSAMTSLDEVGRYSAAYRILLLISGAYYLIIQSLYPRLSAAANSVDTRPDRRSV